MSETRPTTAIGQGSTTSLRTPGRPDSRPSAAAREHGWNELFAESYPHAGGPQHVALFLENHEGFEVEIVAPTP